MAADGQKAREIIDAMVDDCRSAMPGWRLDEGRGTFNDVLGQRSAIHPIVLAFARAHIEAARVTLGPEHVWLAILQGVAALLRHGVAVDAQQPGAQSAAARQGYAGESSTADTGRSSLSDLWRALRDSSAVPGVLVAAHSGHHVRVFGDDVADRHTLHGSRGAAPLAMAAAAAGHIRQTGRSQVLLGRPSSNKQRVVQRQTNPAWMEALARGPGIQGMTLTGSLQSWAALCVLSQQLKETYTGQRSRGFDWWLHRQHLLCRDLADYYAAQEEFIQTGSVPKVWTEWLALALFDGHSGAPRGTRMDGWLGALFAVDCVGMPVHERERWWIEWEDVPSGIDLVRVKHGSGGWVNLYSGFVGIQQLVNDPVRSRAETGTLLGDDLEAAFGLYPTTNGQSAVNTARRKSAAAAAAAGGDGDGVGVRDCADTLTASREEPMMTQGSASPRASSVSERDLNRAYCMATGQPLPASPERPPPLQRAMAPLIGWALDR
ncbi:hypothetical protein GGI07_003132 [Coemansia sp. Benny D115]|nr:hypothetical protein GGI07_003132 [Coemansia sp. Benny D115]